MVCGLGDIPDGGGRLFDFGEGQAAFRMLILRSGDQYFGYVNRCPHFGVPLAERDAQLITVSHRMVKCNVHYSHFRWQDGLCDEGECVGESLQSVPLAIVDGTVRMGA